MNYITEPLLCSQVLFNTLRARAVPIECLTFLGLTATGFAGEGASMAPLIQEIVMIGNKPVLVQYSHLKIPVWFHLWW